MEAPDEPAADLVEATGKGAAYGAVLGGAGGAIGHGIQAAGSKLLCKVSGIGWFVAGTEVLMADGSSTSIEDIETDHEVMTYNPETDQTEKRRVVRAYGHEDKPTYDLVVEDGEKVTATSEHPFMVEGKGYIPVDQLEKGDLLIRADGSTIEVLSINATGETATVHNVEVEGLHNYYVRAGEHWMLVHNQCDIPVLDMAKQGKHIPGHPNFLEGRSELPVDPAELIKKAGSGTPLNSVARGEPGFRERVDFGKHIGYQIEPDAPDVRNATTKGIIHYAKKGAHIVPARP